MQMLIHLCIVVLASDLCDAHLFLDVHMRSALDLVHDDAYFDLQTKQSA